MVTLPITAAPDNRRGIDAYRERIAALDTLPLEEVEELATALRAEMQRIDAQLIDPQREEASGNRAEYARWRRAAAYAKTRFAGEYTRVKARMSALRRDARIASAGGSADPRALLGRAYELIQRMRATTDYDLDTNEQAVVDAMRYVADGYGAQTTPEWQPQSNGPAPRATTWTALGRAR